jgi:hypothetical protein
MLKEFNKMKKMMINCKGIKVTQIGCKKLCFGLKNFLVAIADDCEI